MNILILIAFYILLFLFNGMFLYISIGSWLEKHKDIDDYLSAIFYTGIFVALFLFSIRLFFLL